MDTEEVQAIIDAINGVEVRIYFLRSRNCKNKVKSTFGLDSGHQLNELNNLSAFSCGFKLGYKRSNKSWIKKHDCQGQQYQLTVMH